MKVLKPELDELREKYGKDQQRMSQEQMKLYRQAGVNPLGGCIPMLLQMPLLIAMYRFFPTSVELRQESFLWADDLSTYDAFINFGFTIPLLGDHLSLFTVLMTATSLLMVKMNAQMTNMGAGANQMKVLQYIFPVMLLFIFNNFASALTYYYLLFNLFSFGQQLLLKKFFINEDAIHAKIQENKKKPKKKSKFQQRLEDIYNEQQKQRAAKQRGGKKKR